MSVSASVGKLSRADTEERQLVLVELLRVLGQGTEEDIAAKARGRKDYREKCISSTTRKQVRSDLERLRKLKLVVRDGNTRPALWRVAEVTP